MLYNLDMTVILAALHTDGKGAIIVSDKMRTTTIGEDEYHLVKFSTENDDNKKIYSINKHVTVAYSGDTAFWSTVIDELKMAVNQTDKCAKVRKKFEDIYRKKLQDMLTMKVLFPYYRSFREFLDDTTRLAAKTPRVFNSFQDNLIEARKHIPNEFLLIGKDDKKAFKLYLISINGELRLEGRGLAALGSGHKYALEPISQQLHLSQSKEKVQAILLGAKKLAEKDEEVGALTDIHYLSIE